MLLRDENFQHLIDYEIMISFSNIVHLIKKKQDMRWDSLYTFDFFLHKKFQSYINWANLEPLYRMQGVGTP